MFRLLLVAALAYAGYRAGRSFLDGVPDGFEAIPPEPNRKRRRRQGKS